MFGVSEMQVEELGGSRSNAERPKKGMQLGKSVKKMPDNVQFD
jgi:hypothetical protein